MSRSWHIEEVVTFLEGDRALLEQLFSSGWFVRREDGLTSEEVELARVAHVLVHELEVNWPGVEVALRLRQELLAQRKQVLDLLELLRQRTR